MQQDFLPKTLPQIGQIHFHTLFRRMEALSPEYPVISEGNSTEELPEVIALFRRVAGECNIPILEN